jgi:hypothetical protein
MTKLSVPDGSLGTAVQAVAAFCGVPCSVTTGSSDITFASADGPCNGFLAVCRQLARQSTKPGVLGADEVQQAQVGCLLYRDSSQAAIPATWQVQQSTALQQHQQSLVFSVSNIHGPATGAAKQQCWQPSGRAKRPGAFTSWQRPPASVLMTRGLKPLKPALINQHKQSNHATGVCHASRVPLPLIRLVAPPPTP